MKELQYYQGLKYPKTIVPLTNGRYMVTYINLPGVMAEGNTKAEAEDNAEIKRLEFTKMMLEKGLPVPEADLVVKFT